MENTDRVKLARLEIRMTESQRAEIQQAAARDGYISVAEWARAALARAVREGVAA